MIINTPKKRLDKSDEIAMHHGFKFEEIPISTTKKGSFLLPEEKKEVVDFYKRQSLNRKKQKPFMIYYDRPLLVNKNISIPNSYKTVGLDIIGVEKSIAEAVIINTAIKILEEEGYTNFFIDINSTGGKDSLPLFLDGLFDHYKKYTKILDNECKKCVSKKRGLSVLNCLHKNCRSVIETAPKPISFLSEKSMAHFKEVLEFLEEMNIPYRINDSLVSENNHYSKTIFEIKTEDKNNNEIILARGGRYDEIASKTARKKDLVATGISMYFKKIKNNKAYSNQIKQPEIFLIQFGFFARLKSLAVVDTLRHSHITVRQNIYKNKLSEQFDAAKIRKMPYMIIIGHQEALDGEIIFKDNIKSCQETVKIEKLTQFLKKKKII